jgi:hypothetical protein
VDSTRRFAETGDTAEAVFNGVAAVRNTQAAKKRFDKLKIFSTPVTEDINGVRTFVVDIAEVKTFIEQVEQEAREEERKRMIGKKKLTYGEVLLYRDLFILKYRRH